MLQVAKSRVKNTNIIAFNVRRRIGRSNREYIDRVVEDTVDIAGTQSGKIKYILTHDNRLIYNTYQFHNEEAAAAAMSSCKATRNYESNTNIKAGERPLSFSFGSHTINIQGKAAMDDGELIPKHEKERSL